MPDPGYGNEHQKLRKQWDQRIRNGARPNCSRCGWPIQPDDPWHLDHTDDRAGYLGPAHSHCNEAAGGRKAQRLRRQPARPASRAW